MERIKTTISITYSNRVQIEVAALFDTVDQYVETIETIEEYINDPQSFRFNSIRLAPYNEDINGDLLNTDLIINLNDILFVRAICQRIEYKEPLNAK